MPPQKGGFFRGDLIGKDEEFEGFARGDLSPTLSEDSLLRVSEIPAKRFDLGRYGTSKKDRRIHKV